MAVLISSKMSRTLRSAEMGADEVTTSYAECRIEIVDTESNSMQEGFAVLAAAACAQRGDDVMACVAAARGSIARSRFLFVPRSLDHLVRGRRIANAAGLLGQALSLSPILTAKSGSEGTQLNGRLDAQGY